MFKSLPKKKHPYTICYFQRSRLSVFIPARKEVAALDFPPTILADVTVVDREQFRKAITKLLAQYKVDAGPVLVVLATDVCFVKEIDPLIKTPVEEEVKALRSSMPYTNVFARVIHQGKKQVVVALNREFYEPLLAVFREGGFDVTTLIPEFILTQPLTEGGLTPELAVQLSEVMDKLEDFDLLESEDKPKLITTSATTPEEKKRTLLLVGVFTALTLILVAVWWWTNRSTPPVRPIVPVLPAVTAPPILVDQLLPEELEVVTPSSSESASLSNEVATRAATVLASGSGTRRATPSAQPVIPLE